jgi:pimeloyl-ACP methyl ester carboxylesterase
MRSEDLTVDVTGAGGLAGPLTVATTVHWPDRDSVPEVVAIGLPGGGYNREYYNLRIDGHDGYSQAEFHTARGWVLIACDTIGTGDSSRPDRPHTITDVAAVQAAVVGELRRRLVAGNLVSGLPPAPQAKVIGLGQSMGGCFTVAAQGGHDCYDAIGVLGYSALHTELPLPEGTVIELAADAAEQSQADVAAAMMASFQFAFHYDDVPAEIAKADMASVPLRMGEEVPAWGVNATPLQCGIDMLTPGIVAAQAAAITSPVLIAQGIRDVVPHPRQEPSAYSSSPDITVFIGSNMAHMHNFASTREQFWRRIQVWAEGL